MIVNQKWLRKYTEIPYSTEELEDRLTHLGLEAKLLENPLDALDTLIIGEVLDVEKHPNADRLSVCKVNTGSETTGVVCGAPNVAAGQKVALALPGTVLPGGFKIKPAKIRGVESRGMICAEDELGISDDHSGIMVLDPTATIGEKLADYLNRAGASYEIDLTPNRPDCTSHIGVARDLTLLTGAPLQLPAIEIREEKASIEGQVEIDIRNSEGCPRYAARLIRDVKIGPSPRWMQEALQSVGLRSINNVVDAANFVLLETGHPLHTFDYAQIRGKKIVVRSAEDGEEVETLDGVRRELNREILLICDAERPVAIAGIMGLANSEITDSTRDILIESAYFQPATIRKGSKTLGLQTEASYRFERGADPDGVIFALNRVSQLIQDLADGKVFAGYVDAYPKPVPKPTVTVRFQKIEDLIGIPFDREWIRNLFDKLGCRILESKADYVKLISPSWRPDLEREVDYIEEVVRVYGMENVPPCSHMQVVPDAEADELHEAIEALRSRVAAFGYLEIFGNSMVSENQTRQTVKPVEPVKVRNPLNQDMAYLRTSLIPGLVATAKRNFNRSSFDLNLFEMGYVHHRFPASETGAAEELRLALLVSGKQEEDNWGYAARPNDVFVLKGIGEALAEEFYAGKLSWSPLEHAEYLHLAEIKTANQAIGTIGELHPAFLKKEWGIESPLFVMETAVLPLIENCNRRVTFKTLPVYPATERDVSIVISEEISIADVHRIIRAQGGQYLQKVRFYDLYRGKNIDKGRKSITFNLVFQAEHRTLKDEEIDERMKAIHQTLSDHLNAKLR